MNKPIQEDVQKKNAQTEFVIRTENNWWRTVESNDGEVTSYQDVKDSLIQRILNTESMGNNAEAATSLSVATPLTSFSICHSPLRYSTSSTVTTVMDGKEAAKDTAAEEKSRQPTVMTFQNGEEAMFLNDESSNNLLEDDKDVEEAKPGNDADSGPSPNIENTPTEVAHKIGVENLVTSPLNDNSGAGVSSASADAVFATSPNSAFDAAQNADVNDANVAIMNAAIASPLTTNDPDQFLDLKNISLRIDGKTIHVKDKVSESINISLSTAISSDTAAETSTNCSLPDSSLNDGKINGSDLLQKLAPTDSNCSFREQPVNNDCNNGVLLPLNCGSQTPISPRNITPSSSASSSFSFAPPPVILEDDDVEFDEQLEDQLQPEASSANPLETEEEVADESMECGNTKVMSNDGTQGNAECVNGGYDNIVGNDDAVETSNKCVYNGVNKLVDKSADDQIGNNTVNDANDRGIDFTLNVDGSTWVTEPLETCSNIPSSLTASSSTTTTTTMIIVSNGMSLSTSASSSSSSSSSCATRNDGRWISAILDLWRCEICGEKRGTADELNQHLKKHGSGENKHFACLVRRRNGWIDE